MIGSWDMLQIIQEPMKATMDSLEGLIAQRRSEGAPMTIYQAASHSHGAEFLRCKDLVGVVKTMLLFQARKEAEVAIDGKVVPASDIAFIRT